MKKAVILFIIFLIILGAGITEHFSCIKPLTTSTSALEKSKQPFKTTTLIPLFLTPKTCKTSGRKTKLVEAISYCQDARQVNVILGELTGSLRCEDTDNAFSKIESLYQLIQNIRDMLDFNAIDII